MKSKEIEIAYSDFHWFLEQTMVPNKRNFDEIGKTVAYQTEREGRRNFNK